MYDCSMLRAIVCRIRDIFSRRTAPLPSESGVPGGVTPWIAAESACSLPLRTWARTSSSVIRPIAAAGSDAPQVDAQFASQATHGGTGRGGRLPVAGDIDRRGSDEGRRQSVRAGAQRCGGGGCGAGLVAGCAAGVARRRSAAGAAAAGPLRRAGCCGAAAVEPAADGSRRRLRLAATGSTAVAAASSLPLASISKIAAADRDRVAFS